LEALPPQQAKALTAARPDVFCDAQAGSGTSAPDLTSLLGEPDALGQLLKKQGAFAVTVDLSGKVTVDFRSVGGVIYAKADVRPF